MKFIQAIVIVMLIFVVLPAYGQKDKIYGGVKQSKADELYEQKGYKASILEYLKLDNISNEDKLKIANAYRLVHETENAELWYEQVLGSVQLNDLKDPIHLMHYAQVLQSNGKEDASASYYGQYAIALKSNTQWDNIANVFSKNVTLTGRFPHTEMELRNERFINTKKLEFSPAIYDKGIVYVTTQTSDQFTKNGKDKWLNENYMSLMTAQKGENNLLEKPEVFSTELTHLYHEGPVSFSNNNTRIYFTMNHVEGKRKKNSNKVRKLQIYSAKWDGKKWDSPVLLNFNTEEHEEAHPALSPDGNTMYFASDRPGGYGGMDLYVSYLENDKWSEPMNMGANVNTPGNEVFPFYHANGMLFYSSNGHDGLGGLDIFHSSVSFNGKWSKAVNAGTPFNSKKDDFGLILDQEGKMGYLTSARYGGIGSDDIYSFELPEELLEPRTIQICVIDKSTGAYLSNTGIKVLEFDSKFSLNSEGFGENKNYQIKPTADGSEFLLVLETDDISRQPVNFYTNEQGLLEYVIEPGMNYKFVAEREGYKLGQKNIAYDQDLESSSDCIVLEVGTDEIMNTYPTDSRTYSDRVADNNVQSTRARGTESVNYTNTARDEANASEQVSKPVHEVAEVIKYIPPVEVSPKKLSFLELGASNLKVGNVIVLENIYYDFNKYYIRDDAKIELDKVVRLLKRFPEMKIELGSHTDARGGDSYNASLSSKRAKSAVEYIASSGINLERLVAKGYGEEKLRNSCRDGKKCSEKDHQYNRRTEIKILQMPYDQVNISYDDNHSQGDSSNQRVRIASDDFTLEDLWRSDDADDEGNNYYVFAGSYSKFSGAEKKRDRIKALGFKVNIVEAEELGVYRIIAGEFKYRSQAEVVISALNNAGINARIKTLDDE